jgi:hypothetical protein
MKRNMCSLIVAALLISLVLPASATTPAGSNDPFAGTWNLNTQKSRYARGACPKRMVIVMETAGEGIRYRSETTYANGNTARAEYTADFSGKEAIVVGSAGLLLPVSLKRLDAYTVVAKYTRGLQVVATSKRVVSRDGRLMSTTTISPDKYGKKVTSVGVYEKADEVGELNNSKRKGDRDRPEEH